MNKVTFFCRECRNTEPFNSATLKQHLADKHNITGQLKGKQISEAFLDGAKGYYQQQWEVTLEPSGLKLTKIVEGDRT